MNFLTVSPNQYCTFIFISPFTFHCKLNFDRCLWFIYFFMLAVGLRVTLSHAQKNPAAPNMPTTRTTIKKIEKKEENI